jgi:hypothetical protein
LSSSSKYISGRESVLDLTATSSTTDLENRAPSFLKRLAKSSFLGGPENGGVLAKHGIVFQNSIMQLRALEIR